MKIDHTLSHKLPLRILVVEDNPVNRQLALRMLERLGYEPDLVDTGQAAIEATRTTTYDLVLMDIHLPDIDGFEAARRIVEAAKSSHPAILATTAEHFSRDPNFASGIDDVLQKPIRFGDLQEKLKLWGPKRAETSTTGALIDAEVFMLLKSTLGDDAEFFQDLIDSFAQQSEGLLRKIHDALARRDTETLQHAAHTLKGSSLNLGARALADLSSTIEAHAAAERLDILPDLLDQLETRYRQSVDRLRVLL